MKNYIVSFSDDPPPSKIGAKAANLVKLKKLNFQVPNSFFLPLDVLSEFIEYNNLSYQLHELEHAFYKHKNINSVRKIAAELRLAIAEGEIQAGLTNDILNLIQEQKWFMGVKLAIRSSAINEDLTNYSFAGQYNSDLNIAANSIKIERSIKNVWSSHWSEQVLEYLYKNSLDLPEPGMAVIIQEMIKAEIAGVLFSQNPENFNKDEIILEYVEGLGEKLVSGEKTPVHLIYDKKEKSFKNIDKVNKRYVKTLNALIEKTLLIENKHKSGIDLEWAYDGKNLVFLQQRAITTQMDDAILWTNENVAEVIPDIVTPFSWSILNPVTNEAFKWFLQQIGIGKYPRQGLFGLYKDKVYFNRTAYQSVINQFYPSTYLNKNNQDNTDIFKRFFGLLKIPLLVLYSLTRFFIFSISIKKKIYSFQNININNYEQITIQNGENLLNRIDEVVNLEKKNMALHVSNTILAEFFYQVFNKFVSKWIKPSSGISASQLLQGENKTESALIGKELYKIALFLKKNNFENDFKLKTWKAIEKRLQKKQAGKMVLDKIDNFMRKYGYNALHEFELLYPRWAEDPKYVYNNLKNYLNIDDLDKYNEQKNVDAEKFVVRTLKEVNIIKRSILFFLYTKSLSFSKERENLKQTFLKLHFTLKRILLSYSADLMREKVIKKPEDIFFLSLEELKRNNKEISKDFQKRVRKRRGKREQFLKQKYPDKIYQSGEVWKPIFDQPGSDKGIMGIGCSSGIIEGSARVIYDPESFDQFLKGEILVAKSTNPGWTPLFVNAAGVVTEIGGALSHGAIIAREYGIPMVTAVQDITGIVKTGDRIQINGDAGTVVILKKKN